MLVCQPPFRFWEDEGTVHAIDRGEGGGTGRPVQVSLVLRWASFHLASRAEPNGGGSRYG